MRDRGEREGVSEVRVKEGDCIDRFSDELV